MVSLEIIVLCPIFIFLIIKSILSFFTSKIKKIIISILIIIINIFIALFLLVNMGFHYIGTIKVFTILNLSIILIINLIKFIIRSKYKKIIISIISVIIIILGILYIYKLIINYYLIENAIVVNVDDIKIDFEENGINTIKKYKNKYFEINGKILYTKRPKDFNPLWDASCIIFVDDIFGKRPYEGTMIECFFDDILAVENLKEGQEITVKCKFKEYNEIDKQKFIAFNKGKIIK